MLLIVLEAAEPGPFWGSMMIEGWWNVVLVMIRLGCGSG